MGPGGAGLDWHAQALQGESAVGDPVGVERSSWKQRDGCCRTGCADSAITECPALAEAGGFVKPAARVQRRGGRKLQRAFRGEADVRQTRLRLRSELVHQP